MVIRCCTVLCIMNAYMQWQRTRPPPYIQRSAWQGRVDVWRRCGSWLLQKVSMVKMKVCLGEVGLRVYMRKLWLLSVCAIVTSLWGGNADEISGQLGLQEQTVGHHLHEVALLAEKLWERGARVSATHRCNTPALWKRISLTFWISSSIGFWFVTIWLRLVFFLEHRFL